MGGELLLADHIVRVLADAGVKRIFGIPGGGSSLDIIDAAARRNIPFILTQTEAAAGLMAAVTGEMTETPGVVLTGVGPGAASVVNAAAYASLERSPLVIFTDQIEGSDGSGIHQEFDQQAVFAPLVKIGGEARSNGGLAVATAIAETIQPSCGPVHLDLSAKQAALPVDDPKLFDWAIPLPTPIDSAGIEGVLERIRKAQRPVVLAGLDSRNGNVPQFLSHLVNILACPVLTTYKAKGVIPDNDPHVIGHVTGGTAESSVLHAADLIITVGLDPIELINQPWPYEAPIVDIAPTEYERGAYRPHLTVSGDMAEIESIFRSHLQTTENPCRSSWTLAEIDGFRQGMRQRLMETTLNDEQWQNDPRCLTLAAMEGVVEEIGLSARLTVDAGAHMFPVMALWQTSGAFATLKSNGLSTMGYALPAAIASVLEEPERPVIAITGDGGMGMCLGELATLARTSGPIVVLVYNDAALSLIDIKQQAQQRPSLGVRYPVIDYAAVAQSFGLAVERVKNAADLKRSVKAAVRRSTPTVIDVTTNPAGYSEMMVALRK